MRVIKSHFISLSIYSYIIIITRVQMTAVYVQHKHLYINISDPHPCTCVNPFCHACMKFLFMFKAVSIHKVILIQLEIIFTMDSYSPWLCSHMIASLLFYFGYYIQWQVIIYGIACDVTKPTINVQNNYFSRATF